MPRDNQLHCAFERSHVQRTSYSQRDHNVVFGAGAVQLVDEPQPALSVGRGNVGGAWRTPQIKQALERSVFIWQVLAYERILGPLR